MLNRDYTFKLKNNTLVSIKHSNIHIKILPYIRIEDSYIDVTQMFILNIRHIIELILNSEIESEHIGLIDASKMTNIHQLEMKNKVELNVHLKDITDENIENDLKDKIFKLITDTSSWLILYNNS